RVTRRRIGTLINSITYAVLVGIHRAAGCINLVSGRAAWALIDIVGHTVGIGILRQRAAVGVHLFAGRSVRALVDRIADSVLVGIERATVSVDLVSRRAAGTLVEAVLHAVAVGVERTPVGVDLVAGRRIGTLICLVQYAVLVGVLVVPPEHEAKSGLDAVVNVLVVLFDTGDSLGTNRRTLTEAALGIEDVVDRTIDSDGERPPGAQSETEKSADAVFGLPIGLTEPVVGVAGSNQKRGSRP